MIRATALGTALCVLATASLARADKPRGHVMGAPPDPSLAPAPAPARPPAPAPAAAPAPAEEVSTAVIPEASTAPTATPAPSDGLATERPSLKRWYGWQILASDGIALTLLLVAAGASDRGGDGAAPAALLSGGVYLFGGPIVHGINGRAGIGAASLGLRLGLPMLGAVLGAGASGGSAGGAAGGLVFGIATAIGIDVGALSHKRIGSREPAPVPAPRSPAPESGSGGTTASFAPSIIPTRGGALAGMVGSF